VIDVETNRPALLVDIETNLRADLAGIDAGSLLELHIE
jgi:hypothetical protein